MRHFTPVLRQNKKSIVLYIVLGVSIAFLSTFSAIIYQRVVDGYTDGSLSMRSIVIYGAILLCLCTLEYIENRPAEQLRKGLLYGFKLAAMEKLETIDYLAYQSLGSGALLHKIESGSAAGVGILYTFWLRLFAQLLPGILFSLFFIARISPALILLLLCGYVVVFFITHLLLRILQRAKTQILTGEESFNSTLLRGFSELIVFRVNRKYAAEIEKARASSRDVIAASTRMLMVHEAFFALFYALVILFKVGVLLLTWRNGTVSVGEAIALLALVDRAYQPIAIANVLYVQYRLDKAAFGRYKSFLDEPDDLQLHTGHALSIFHGDIRLDSLTFGYGRPLFQDFSLHLAPGSAVAFVGESGSGKSTIVKLVCGFLKPEAGRVLADGTDLSTLALDSFYRHLSYTPQEAPVFSGTLRENITFGAPVPDEAILEALRAVELGSFFESLPNGLDTLVGERGSTLSGGERQRLALARLWFSNATLFILDEATSALDNVTEARVMQALTAHLSGKTILIVAHRLNGVRSVGRILAFQKGRVVEDGTFNELLAHNGYFSRLYTAGQLE